MRASRAGPRTLADGGHEAVGQAVDFEQPLAMHWIRFWPQPSRPRRALQRALGRCQHPAGGCRAIRRTRRHRGHRSVQQRKAALSAGAGVVTDMPPGCNERFGRAGSEIETRILRRQAAGEIQVLRVLRASTCRCSGTPEWHSNVCRKPRLRIDVEMLFARDQVAMPGFAVGSRLWAESSRRTSWPRPTRPGIANQTGCDCDTNS